MRTRFETEALGISKMAYLSLTWFENKSKKKESENPRYTVKSTHITFCVNSEE